MPVLRAAAVLLLACSFAAAEEDAFNLGILGAEGLPQKEGKGGASIRVTAVLPNGPAKQAGLVEGDVVLGVGSMTLGQTKLPVVYQLVDLLEKASSQKSAKASLLVQRAGKRETIPIALPSLGPHSANCPVGCARCEREAAESLAYLAKAQNGDGSFETKYGGTNGQVVVTCLAGLAFLASGSTPTDGPYAKNIARAAEYVEKNCGKEMDFGGMGGGQMGGGNWNQTNWAYAYSPVFLGEVYRIAPSAELKAKLEEMMQAIAKNQEQSGGWAHGPGGPNALGYLELQIVGNWCLTALGTLKRLGFKVPQACVDRGVAYAISTSEGDGGVGYSDRAGQKGMGDPGRTAGCIWAFSLLGLQKNPFYAKMAGFFKRTMDGVPNGHVSPVMHFTASAFACMHLGGAYWKQFMDLFRLEILAARRPDGTFSARPTEESEQLHSNTDREMGPIWTTASYALILQLPKGKLATLTSPK